MIDIILKRRKKKKIMNGTTFFLAPTKFFFFGANYFFWREMNSTTWRKVIWLDIFLNENITNFYKSHKRWYILFL